MRTPLPQAGPSTYIVVSGFPLPDPLLLIHPESKDFLRIAGRTCFGADIRGQA